MSGRSPEWSGIRADGRERALACIISPTVRARKRLTEGVDGSMPAPITPLRVGDVVRLKKTHPCGTNEWEVTRLGMDIGLACRGCGRRVRLLRAEFDRRYRGHISGGQPTG